MASTVIDSKVFGALFSTDEMRHVFSDLNLVQKWLDTEAALAQAQGELGVIPKTQAEDIVKYAVMLRLLILMRLASFINPLLLLFHC